MFIRASTLILSLVGLATTAIAAPGSEAIAARGDTGGSQCDTGTLSCCNQTLDANSGAASLLGILDILTSVDGLVGLSCTPITVIGTGSGADCQQQPVCCTGNTYNGFINTGCSPFNLNL
ncbi:fungal hydrophobin [Gyrodon lividus]|nr:fungal hydrophobin [Gyrodon lividus]